MNNMDDYPFGPPMGISNYHSPNPPYGLPALSTRAAQNNQTSRNAPVSQPYQPKSAKTNYQSHSTSSSTSQPPSSSRRRAPATFPPTPAQVIELAKEAMRQAIDAGEQPEQNKHGLTVHLQENNIGNLPPDVVDIIKEKLKEELARITLAHNQLSSLPARFADLTSLRYLNLRQNRFMEFPMVVCELVGLEILDLSRNELTRLPEQLGKLKALKVFSLRHNQVEELPWCLAKMDSLMCLKAESNPLTFPPAPILHAQPDNTLNGMYRDEKEKQDVIITKQVKTYLKQLLREQSIQRERAETESNNGDTSSEGAETPKPVRRVMSGRFPVKVDGKEVPAPDMRSPALPRPPIPIRSHFRGPSQHNATLRRPGITPLSISNSNERLRSNSESLLQRDKNDRSRRMGYINKKANELPSVNEAKANRYSHLRGLSHGSALQSGGGVSSSHDGSGPTSPAESVNGKTGFQRRLSSLPERKRQSESPNAVVEAAKGVLFAIEIGLPLIQRLMVLARTSPKRSSLEMLFYSATPHIEALQDSIYRYETYTEEDEEIAPKSHMEVLSTVMTAIQTHRHVCVSLARNLKPIVRDGADHYIRSLWFILINSMCEMRHSGSILMRALRGGKTLESVGENEAANLTLRPRTQSRPTQPQAQVQVQSRPNFVIPPAAAVSVRQRNQTAAMRNPSNLHVMTDSKNVAKESRANTISSVTPSTDINDGLLEYTSYSLKRCTDQAVAVLPTVNKIFINLVRKCQQNGDVEDLKKHWQVLVQRCTLALQTAEQLQRSLCAPKSMRNPQEFKAQINAFINAYYNLAAKTKEVKQITTQLTSEVVAMLRPIQKRVQEVNRSITDSHWRHILVETPSSVSTGTSTPVIANGYPVSSNPAYGVLSPPPTVALPMTPASAALGPAVQATVPSTPGYQSTMFTGTVFERADAFLASQPSSALSSRTGTMTGGSFGGGVGLGGYGMANGNGMRNASDLGGTVKRV